MNRRMTFVWGLFFVALLLVGCGAKARTLPEIGNAGEPLQVWIDAPLPASSFLPNTEVLLVFHAASADGIDEFIVKINDLIVETIEAINVSGKLYFGEMMWEPPQSGLYSVQVEAVNQSSSASVTIRLMISAAVTETVVPVDACSVTALVNLFCRPAPGYEPIDNFQPNQSAEVVGQSEYLWHVNGPNYGFACVVPKDTTLVSVNGDCDAIPIVTVLPSLTPTATPTLAPTSTSTPSNTATPAIPECNDGIDNDGDGNIDLRDRECRDSNDTSEKD